jgi:hypothetical protein
METIKLTDMQYYILSNASTDKPIYGENPSFSSAQMPNGSHSFNLRSLEALVKRGFLVSDNRGGYLLTPEGHVAHKTGSVSYR